MRQKVTPGVVLGAVAVFLLAAGSATAVKLIRSSQIKDHTIQLRDISSSAQRALRGQQGPPGIESVVLVDGPVIQQCADGGGSCQLGSSIATCPAGYRATGGGFEAGQVGDVILYSKAGANTFGVIADNKLAGPNSIKAQAVCAAGRGLTANAASAARFRRDLKRRAASYRR
jgi:hypothetical protein